MEKFNNQNLKNIFPEDDGISVADVLVILASHLKIIFLIPMVLLIIVTINSFFQNSSFSSTAKIMTSTNSDFNGALGIAAQFGINIPTGQASESWDSSEIIKSRTLARAMLKRKFNTNEFGPQKSLLQILTYGKEPVSIGLDTLVKQGIDAFIDMIQIEKEGNFLEIKVTASEPIFVRDLTKALLEELDSHQKQYDKTKTSQTRKFIENRIDDIQKELSKAEDALMEFVNRNRRLENSASLQLERERLSREVGVLSSVFTTLKQQLETTKIEEVKDSNYVIVLDPPEAPLYSDSSGLKNKLLLSIFIGLGIGIAFAFFLEFINNSSKEDKEKMILTKSIILKNFKNILPKKYFN